jgi:hypothetical protein
MDREKKISLRHYVNTNLKERTGESGVDDNLFPLYLEIIYRRQHFQIKSVINKRFTRDLGNANKRDRELMVMEMNRVYKIVRFEENIFGDHHKLKRIGYRYLNYNAAVFDIVEDGLRIELKTIVRKHFPDQFTILNFDKRVVPVENLFVATKALCPELGKYLKLKNYEMELRIWKKYFESFPRRDLEEYKYPAFFDWISDQHFAKISKILEKDKNMPKDMIDEILGKVDETIRLSTIEQ